MTPEEEIQILRAEVARLKAGGCARDQRTTQFCAEAADRDTELRVLHLALKNATRAFSASDWRALATVHPAVQPLVDAAMVHVRQRGTA